MKGGNMNMSANLKTVSCDPICGFMVRSHDTKEIIDIIKDHAKHVHNMKITDNEVKAKMK